MEGRESSHFRTQRVLYPASCRTNQRGNFSFTEGHTFFSSVALLVSFSNLGSFGRVLLFFASVLCCAVLWYRWCPARLFALVFVLQPGCLGNGGDMGILGKIFPPEIASGAPAGVVLLSGLSDLVSLYF
jgi:hypothetical protein